MFRRVHLDCCFEYPRVRGRDHFWYWQCVDPGLAARCDRISRARFSAAFDRAGLHAA